MCVSHRFSSAHKNVWVRRLSTQNEQTPETLLQKWKNVLEENCRRLHCAWFHIGWKVKVKFLVADRDEVKFFHGNLILR